MLITIERLIVAINAVVVFASLLVLFVLQRRAVMTRRRGESLERVVAHLRQVQERLAAAVENAERSFDDTEPANGADLPLVH